MRVMGKIDDSTDESHDSYSTQALSDHVSDYPILVPSDSLSSCMNDAWY